MSVSEVSPFKREELNIRIAFRVPLDSHSASNVAPERLESLTIWFCA